EFAHYRPDRRGREFPPPTASSAYRGRQTGSRARCGRAFHPDGNAGANPGGAQEPSDFSRPRDRPDRIGAVKRRDVALLSCIKGGRVVDPANARDAVADVWMRDGRIVETPPGDAEESYDATGKIVMAGAIDIHSHIASDNVNRARLLLPEFHRARSPNPGPAPLSNAPCSTFETGCLYASMGFTTVVEPAVAPDAALHAHLELADTPIIDKAILVDLGNDDFLLDLLRRNEARSIVADYVAWTLEASRALGIKVINAGGAAAFKANARE